MKSKTIAFDARKTLIGRLFVFALIASFLFGIFLIGRTALSLIGRENVDDRLQREAKVFSGVIVGYESRQSARRGRFYWFPMIRVSAGNTTTDFLDQHRFFDSKPDAKSGVPQTVTVEFSSELSVLRVRESYLADKPRLIRNDLLMLLTAFILSSLFPFAWLRGRRTKEQAKKA